MRRHDDPDIKAQWEALRGQLILRSGERCETCGAQLGAPGWSAHHRCLRGMGGTRRAGINALSNLLAVCGSGSTGCHGWIHGNPKTAYRLGWMMPSTDYVLAVSARTPVVLYSGRRVLLDSAVPSYREAPGDPYDLNFNPFRK